MTYKNREALIAVFLAALMVAFVTIIQYFVL